MKTHSRIAVTVVAVAAASLAIAAPPRAEKNITLEPIGRYRAADAPFDEGAAEIVAHDPKTQRLFVINAFAATIDVLDVRDPRAPTLLFTIDGKPYGAGINSVAVHHGVVAAAVEADPATDPGKVVFFDTDGAYLSQVTVGALPDMVTFTPNGSYVLVANEGQPSEDYSIDPEGSVSIIDARKGIARLTQADVRTAGFAGFSKDSLDLGIRIFGPNATVAQDLEPEYITVSHDSKTAWVTLQENNAIATLDLRAGRFTKLQGLGFKNHSLPANKLDASNEDDAIDIRNWPIFGMYQPDAIASFRYRNKTYLITANEGDARDYDGFSEETTVGELTLDPNVFPPDLDLQDETRLGNLKVTSANGDADGNGQYEALYAYGARSFSIWSEDGALVFDSGDALEQITAAAYPDNFNASNANNRFDNRSDDKGPEPEGVAVGQIAGRTYAFIGLERIGGIVVYEVTDPARPRFLQYINNRNFSGSPRAGTAGDLGPEGLRFIAASDSPTKEPLLVVGNEVSGSTTIYRIRQTN